MLAATAEGLLSDDTLRSSVDVLVRFVEAAGALVIFVGAALAAFRFVRDGLRTRDAEVFVPVRLGLGRFLALGLEFQLASDILRTAVAPSYEELGKLAAVAAIRTALNFFLAREITEEAKAVAADKQHDEPYPGRRDHSAVRERRSTAPHGSRTCVRSTDAAHHAKAGDSTPGLPGPPDCSRTPPTLHVE